MRKARTLAAVLAAGAVLGACNDDITVPNYNNPTTGGVASDPTSLQLLANGLAYQLGASPGYIDDLGTLGRESFEYTPTEGRNTTNFLTALRLDRAGFAAGHWAARYNNLRNGLTFRTAVEDFPISAAQKSAANGYAKTIEALELYYVIASRDTLGAPVQVDTSLSFVAPFVSRDSVYKFISARLDEAASDLGAAGTAAFPFTVQMEFRGVGPANPTNFLRFNRAIAARVYAYRGSMQGRDPRLACAGTSCYQRTLDALAQSFISAPTSRTQLENGVYNIYSLANGAIQNTLSRGTTTGTLRYAHPSILRDTAAGPAARDSLGRAVYSTVNAARAADLRTQAKIITLATPASPPAALATSAISTPYGFSLYTSATSSIPVIRNEELILLRAEAYNGLGQTAQALADINTIRTVSGGQTALTALASGEPFITELLYQRWLSLLYEGHRVIDHRRFNRLNDLPLDKVATPANATRHYINSVLPIPQQECLNRAIPTVATTPDFRPPSCTS